VGRWIHERGDWSRDKKEGADSPDRMKDGMPGRIRSRANVSARKARILAGAAAWTKSGGVLEPVARLGTA
jgi:hypothetical protein